MSGQSLMSQEVWQAAISNIQRQLIPHSFATWFRPLTLGSIHNNRLQILLPNRFFKEWFEEHYLEFLRSALEDLLFTRVEIELVVPEQDASPPPPPKETPPQPTLPPPPPAPPPPPPPKEPPAEAARPPLRPHHLAECEIHLR